MFVFVSFCVVLYLFYYVSTRKFNYWEKKKVPYLRPFPLLGNYGKYILQQEPLALLLQKICRTFPKEPYVGAYYGTEPVLIVQDPEILKIILTKDFSHFNGREISDHSYKEAANLNLFGAHGDRWRVLRQNLTPLFSSSKIKNMFHLIQDASYTFENLLDSIVSTSNSVNMKTLSQDYTLTCLAACAFGVDANVLDNRNTYNPIRNIADIVLDISRLRMMKANIRNIWPSIFYGLKLTIFPKEISYLVQLVKNVLKERGYKPSSRNDFVDLLMSWTAKGEISGDGFRDVNNKENRVTFKVDDNLLLAQSLIIFGAGFETSSITLSHTLFELAKDKEAQERVLEEVDDFLLKHENKLVYDCLTELPFLEACINEALRLYPVLGMVSREVMKDYTLPTGLRLEKNLRIHIPVHHLHHHPEYFPEPEVFRPERFFGDAKKEVNPYIFMPFGEGPRICIGMRFAKMKMLACLVTIFKKYQVELAEGMSSTLRMEPRAFAIMTGDINLKLTLRDGCKKRQFLQ